jgi:hypothetical protein
MVFNNLNMKKIFTLAMLLFSMATYAQGNLQFNQVRTFTGNISINSFKLFDTIPQGKVWKIEAIGLNQFCFLNINGRNYVNYFLQGTNNGNGITSVVSNENLWLKSGDVVGYYSPWNSNCATCSFDYIVSVIEYNIIPQ